jgi:4-diphosphocytidyl-2C-methyl-D-erythritol kinase
VLAVANDLLVAAGEVGPGLPTFRRSLARLLGHPVGQSGSGPTCWALYPSLDAAQEATASVRDAAAAGRLPALGDGAPFVAATTIQAGGGTDA